MSVSTSGIPSPVAKDGVTPRSLDARKRVDSAAGRILSNEGIGINGGTTNSMDVGGGEFKHIISRETLLLRPREIREMKKAMIASNVASSRRRKSTSRTETPRWQLMLTILTKFVLLLVAILWLGQLIWKWREIVKYSKNMSNAPFDTLESEARLSEVEANLKTTVKMLQVQLDVVDKKIGAEVSSAKIELNKLLEEKGMFMEKELKSLGGQTDAVGKSLSELKAMELLSKEEFHTFVDEFKKSRNLDHNEEDVSLDDIRNFCRDIVEKEIEKHAADGLGKVDYALASGGAKIIGHSEPYIIDKYATWPAFAKVLDRVHSNAQKMLEPSFGEPGQCFALQGNNGFVIIKLRSAIIPQAVTLEHVSKSVAYDRSNAPKHCRVLGWFQGLDDEPSKDSEKMNLLMEFAYDLEKSNAQTFDVKTANSGPINMVRFEFSSNHGSSKLTCIYRFRMHGYESMAEMRQ